VEDSCNVGKEEEGNGIYAKLSVTTVIKRDTSVTIALSTPGTDNPKGATGPKEVKDKRQ